ncbi:excinuclease ABC subunit A [Kineococcus xinjiangensis]|uniref:UvrABC system protein A n=1 Tax=Kineococcus xinjiangensis TaxID=512762 RepID=A0A2S6IUD8_9ACTN|nr:excinuclease ABC subunit UvrA [Kineococcus xinjiangensis]PPK97885.1 excinuclease ABC subunit A [Kineococcus xinjiangensis]
MRVRGARENNLCDVDVDIPRDAFVAFTGVSGSGKSSLAFGTLYAEAQRRYFESVAPYARRLLQQVPAPHVDSVTGLPPAVALQQNRAAPSSRSSVGTVTTLSNSLRMLFSRAGDYPAGARRLDSDAFSPNTTAGACPGCSGVGAVFGVSEASLVPDPSLSIREGAVAAWPGAWQGKNLRDILAVLGHDVDRPWRELPQEERDWILFTEERPVVTVHPVREAGRIQRPYQGMYQSARHYVLTAFAGSSSAATRNRVRRFLDARTCPECAGRRLGREALAVTFAGRDIAELSALPLAGLVAVLAGSGREGGDDAAGLVVRDLLARTRVLLDLGLGYLALDRAAPTLSAGELQRLRLATQLRSGLFGVVYVLDEPSAGLHPADTEALVGVLEGLREAGNTVFAVEHDMAVVRRADWLVDVGPCAGAGGGRVLHSGPVAGVHDVAESRTRHHLDPAPPPGRRPRPPVGWIRLRGVTHHTVRGLDVDVPTGVLTAVTGVSGAGKSTLLQALADVAARHLGVAAEPEPEEDPPGDEPGGEPGDEPGAAAEGPASPVGAVDQRPVVAAAEGLEALARLVRVDQRPLGRTPRSNLATYTGIFDAVRRVFAATEEARRRRWGASRFSFNVAAGRCPTCRGEGFVAVRLLFLPGTYAPCPDCGGSRYAPETLEVLHRGRSVADVLALSVDEALEALDDVPAAVRGLRALQRVGLGYLRLGQPATELSGGEAQRVKLATELQRSGRGRTLYLLDEPTTGLHPADVELLLGLLQELVDAGGTVVVAEHDLDVVAAADHVLDLGPGAGDAGGRLVAAGAPREVAATADAPGTGPTAHHLARFLGG